MLFKKPKQPPKHHHTYALGHSVLGSVRPQVTLVPTPYNVKLV